MDSNFFSVLRTSPHAILPQRRTQHSVGFDLFALDSISVEPHSSLLVNTGIKTLLPKGCFGKIESRSSLAKHLLFCGAGVIDPDYTGEIKVLLINHGNNIVNIPYGRSCAQLLLLRVRIDQPCPIEMLSEKTFHDEHAKRYPMNERQDSGFGSTDNNAISL